MTLREYMIKEGLKKCPKCGKIGKECQCAKDFDNEFDAAKDFENEFDAAKDFDACVLKALKDLKNEKKGTEYEKGLELAIKHIKGMKDGEEIDESLALGVGLAAAAGIAALTTASIIKQFKLKKWQEARKKASLITLARTEQLQNDKVLSLIGIKDGKIETKLIPMKSFLEKYFDGEKHDFDGFIKALEEDLTTRYKDLAKIFSDPSNEPIVKASGKATAEFYCYLVKFTADEKKAIKDVVEKATKEAGYDKGFKVKIMVEKA